MRQALLRENLIGRNKKEHDLLVSLEWTRTFERTATLLPPGQSLPRRAAAATPCARAHHQPAGAPVSQSVSQHAAGALTEESGL